MVWVVPIIGILGSLLLAWLPLLSIPASASPPPLAPPPGAAPIVPAQMAVVGPSSTGQAPLNPAWPVEPERPPPTIDGTRDTVTPYVTKTRTPTSTPSATPTAEATATATQTATATATHTATAIASGPTPAAPNDSSIPPNAGPLTLLRGFLANPLAMGGAILMLMLAPLALVVRWTRRKPPTSRLEKGKRSDDLLPSKVLPSTEPPPAGIPYLASMGRPAGTLYYPLAQAVTTVGREPDNTLVIDEQFVGWESVSKHHARFQHDGKTLTLQDLNSTNGVWLNEQRTGLNLVQEDCTLHFGQVQFAFHMNQGGAAR